MDLEVEVARLRTELNQVKELQQSQLKLLNVLIDRVLREESPVEKGRYPTGPDQYTMYDLEKWVIKWIGNTLERRASNTRRWCPEWYKHNEVVSRFWILFHSYQEIVSGDDAVMQSTWFVDQLDRHLDAIFSADGPFAGCSVDRHSPHGGLPVKPNPDAERDWGPRPAHKLTFPPLRYAQEVSDGRRS